MTHHARFLLSALVVVPALMSAPIPASADVPNNSVKSKSIVNGQVKTKDIKNDGIKGKDIKDGTIEMDDISGSLFPALGLLKAVDNNGQEIGPLLNEYAVLRQTTAGQYYGVGILWDGFVGGTVYFMNNDCTGTPYLSRFAKDIVSWSGVAPDPTNSGKVSAYVRADKTPVVNVTINSRWRNTDTPPCTPNTDTEDFNPVGTVVDLSTFTPPFSAVAP